MKFYSRKLIKPEDLNANNTLFGGKLLAWIDEEAGIYAMTKLQSRKVVTKFMSETNFLNSAKQGDVIEIGLELLDVGTTSISFSCEVRNLFSLKKIVRVEQIVFVNVDEKERPKTHGKNRSEFNIKISKLNRGELV